MVQPHVPPHPSLEHLPASASLEQTDSEPAALPRDRVCPLHGHLLAIHPATADGLGHLARAGRAFLPPGRLRVGGFAAG